MAEPTTITADPVLFSRPVDVESIPKNGIFKFEEAPSEAELIRIKPFLGLLGLRKMRLTGEIMPLGKKGWEVSAMLGASVTQECVVTLEPVKTRIDVPVRVRFLPAEMIPEDRPETELDEDIEPLERVIDLGKIAIEALIMALPDYPRKENAALDVGSAIPDGAEPIRDEDLKPFAGLAGLKEKLGNEGE